MMMINIDCDKIDLNIILLINIMTEEMEKPKLGRPRVYGSLSEINEAKRRYRSEWYQRNKKTISEKNQDEDYKENRRKRKLKGFYLIFNKVNNDAFIGWSEDVTNRVQQTLRKIRNPDTTGRVVDKFDKNISWEYRMIEFWEQKHDNEREDKIRHDLRKDNPNINFI